MKNSKGGFVVTPILGIITLFIIGAGIYIYLNHHKTKTTTNDVSSMEFNPAISTIEKMDPHQIYPFGMTDIVPYLYAQLSNESAKDLDIPHSESLSTGRIPYSFWDTIPGTNNKIGLEYPGQSNVVYMFDNADKFTEKFQLTENQPITISNVFIPTPKILLLINRHPGGIDEYDLQHHTFIKNLTADLHKNLANLYKPINFNYQISMFIFGEGTVSRGVFDDNPIPRSTDFIYYGPKYPNGIEVLRMYQGTNDIRSNARRVIKYYWENERTFYFSESAYPGPETLWKLTIIN